MVTLKPSSVIRPCSIVANQAHRYKSKLVSSTAWHGRNTAALVFIDGKAMTLRRHRGRDQSPGQGCVLRRCGVEAQSAAD
jgi:hypothetical protein